MQPRARFVQPPAPIPVPFPEHLNLIPPIEGDEPVEEPANIGDEAEQQPRIEGEDNRDEVD